MRRLAKFRRLSAADQGLLAASAVLLLAMRLGLRTLSFQTLQRLVARIERRGARPADPAAADRIAWAVSVASRHVPGPNRCLSQALAAHLLLARAGCPAKLRIGVARHDGQLEAHAWVESDDRVLIGGTPDRARYVPLASVERR